MLKVEKDLCEKITKCFYKSKGYLNLCLKTYKYWRLQKYSARFKLYQQICNNQVYFTFGTSSTHR